MMHEVIFHRMPMGYWLARCTCGWSCINSSKPICERLAATHDLD